MPATAPARPAPTADTGNSREDGRRARGERTRRALTEALLALLDEGCPQPTARQVAERAGVSLRLVFHHFDDMEAVLRSAVAVQVERHWSRLRPVDASLPRPKRVAELVRRRAALFEAIAPVRRAAAQVEATSATVAAEQSHARLRLRDDLLSTFAPELAAAGRGRATLLHMLEAVSGWESWDALRRRMGLTPAAARRVTARLLDAVLDSSPDPEGHHADPAHT